MTNSEILIPKEIRSLKSEFNAALVATISPFDILPFFSHSSLVIRHL
jgi:hypothetical protein